MLRSASLAKYGNSPLHFCIFLGLSLSSVASSMHKQNYEKDERLLTVTVGETRAAMKSEKQNLRGGTQNSWKFWVDPESQAMVDASRIQPQDGQDARRIRYIAQQPAGVWYGEWSGSIGAAVQAQVQAARSEDAYAVLIAYNIPYRDCGQHSAGGASAAEYTVWIKEFAAALNGTKAIVILEPDALTLNNCLSSELKAERYSLLRDAVRTLKQNPSTQVYIDAGHSAWLSAEETAQRLQMAGIGQADGFALNVSNYQTTTASIQFGRAVQNIVGRDKLFVVDTSRNGAGPSPNNEWCNPRGRALGMAPTSATAYEGVAAFLWLKRPGESDGECNGGPAAGAWWRDMALELARNAGL